MRLRLIKFFFFLFYRVERAEYISFGFNEYLIRYLKRRLPFLPKETTFCERSIGYDRRHLRKNGQKLKKEGVKVDQIILTLEEFDRFSTNHPILKNDDWVLMRKEAKGMREKFK